MKKVFANRDIRRIAGVLRYLLLVAPLAIAPLALSGCVGSVVSTVKEIVQAGQQIKRVQSELPVADVMAGESSPLPPDEIVLKAALAQPSTLLSQSKSTNSGPGLLVCEPEIKGEADKSTLDFGAGCGRWLHLATAGLPQFGLTPSWYGFDYALREMGKNDGRVSEKEAAALAKILAVTHVATGVLSGSGNRSTLTYRLWKMPEQKAVGGPIVVSGNKAQIVASLPSMAKSLAARLKGDLTLVPAKTEVSAIELEGIGAVPRYASRPVDASTAQVLKNLAARSPLAGMEYLAHLSSLENEDDDADAVKAVKDAGQKLLQQGGKNPLVLAHVGLEAESVLNQSKVVKNLATRFSNNYLISYAELKQHRASEQRASQRLTAERIVAGAPGSAWAWLQLETALSDATSDVRDGRYFSRMTTAEQRFVSGMYPQMVQACLQAVRCDSLNAEAWGRLSYAAAANSDDALADAAFWKSISLPSRDDSTFNWGLQLYQSKWQGDAAKLRRMARMIVNDEPLFVRKYWDVVEAFQDSGRAGEAKQFENLAVAALEKWLQSHPTDFVVRSDLGHLFKVRKEYSRAAREFQIVIRQQPQEDNGYQGLALVYEHQNDWKNALQNYLKAIALDPENAQAIFRGGQCYHQMGQYTKAEPLYKKCIAVSPDYAEPYNRLADLFYFVKNDKKGAEKLYRKAIALDPETQLFRDNLKRCLGS